MLRTTEVGSYNLAEYVEAHATELEIGSDFSKRLPDEVLAPRLHRVLEGWHATERRDGERAAEAALCSFVSSVRSQDGGYAMISAAPLFRLAATTRGYRYLRFVGDGLDLLVVRGLLVRAGVALRPFKDAAAHVDGDGLHIVWRAGRGRLNLYPHRLKQPEDALIVRFPPRSVRRNLPALLGDVLAELGFGT